MTYDWAPGSTAGIAGSTTPADGTTTGAVLVTAPDGTTSSPSVTGALNGSVWTGTAQLPLLLAGVWSLTWTIVGTGAGVEQQTITVGPALPQAGRAYATTTDWANWTGTAAPADAQKRLRDATREVDRLLATALYAVDDDGMPIAAAAVEALRDATCAEAVWLAETASLRGAQGAYSSVSIGSVTLARAPTARPGQEPPRVAAEAIDILRLAGLLGHEPRTY